MHGAPYKSRDKKTSSGKWITARAWIRLKLTAEPYFGVGALTVIVLKTLLLL
jgi:hypothetical protein